MAVNQADGSDEVIDEPSEVDVLCGRGGMSNHHPGNEWYRRLIRSNRPLYRACPKHTKLLVSKAIVQAVEQQGGRFLERNKARGTWNKVSYKRAVDKTSQGLRERDRDEENGHKDDVDNAGPVQVPESFSGRNRNVKLSDLADVAIQHATSGIVRAPSANMHAMAGSASSMVAKRPAEAVMDADGRAQFSHSGQSNKRSRTEEADDMNPLPPDLAVRQSSMFRMLKHVQLIPGVSDVVTPAQKGAQGPSVSQATFASKSSKPFSDGNPIRKKRSLLDDDDDNNPFAGPLPSRSHASQQQFVAPPTGSVPPPQSTGSNQPPGLLANISSQFMHGFGTPAFTTFQSLPSMSFLARPQSGTQPLQQPQHHYSQPQISGGQHNGSQGQLQQQISQGQHLPQPVIQGQLQQQLSQGQQPMNQVRLQQQLSQGQVQIGQVRLQQQYSQGQQQQQILQHQLSQGQIHQVVNNGQMQFNQASLQQQMSQGSLQQQMSQGSLQHQVSLQQQVSQGLQQQLSQGLQQQVSQGLPQQMSQALQQQISQGLQQQMSQGLQQQMSQGLQQQIGQDMSTQMNQGIPQQMSQGMPQQMNQRMPQRVSHGMQPQQVSQGIQQQRSQGIQQQRSQGIQQQRSQGIQQQRSQGIQQQRSQGIQQQRSHGIPQHTSHGMQQTNRGQMLVSQQMNGGLPRLTSAQAMPAPPMPVQSIDRAQGGASLQAHHQLQSDSATAAPSFTRLTTQVSDWLKNSFWPVGSSRNTEERDQGLSHADALDSKKMSRQLAVNTAKAITKMIPPPQPGTMQNRKNLKKQKSVSNTDSHSSSSKAVERKANIIVDRKTPKITTIPPPGPSRTIQIKTIPPITNRAKGRSPLIEPVKQVPSYKVSKKDDHDDSAAISMPSEVERSVSATLLSLASTPTGGLFKGLSQLFGSPTNGSSPSDLHPVPVKQEDDHQISKGMKKSTGSLLDDDDDEPPEETRLRAVRF